MTFSLSTIATALTTVSTVIKATEVIYEAGAQLIVNAENAYANTVGTGATKKAAVMAALKAFVLSIGESWDDLKAELSAWIDLVISSWNSLKSLAVSSTNTSAAAVVNTTSVDQSQVVV